MIEFINTIFRMLNELIDDKKCSGIGRDCCLDLVVKFVDRANGCNWTSKFIVSGIYRQNLFQLLIFWDFHRCTKGTSSSSNRPEFIRSGEKILFNK